MTDSRKGTNNWKQVGMTPSTPFVIVRATQTNDVGIESHEDSVVSTPNQITEVVTAICGTEPCCPTNDGDDYTYDKSTP